MYTSISNFVRHFKNERDATLRILNALSDESLSATPLSYGRSLGRLAWHITGTLTSLLFHQAHHRGQMTVLMRQAGLKVPGIYGPAREEWQEFGMAAPD